MTNSMTRYETVFESTKNLPRFIEIGHGENADLYTSITDCGVPVSLSGYTVSALYQPSSKWGTTEYYSCPLEVVGNTVIIHWSHLQDNGDNGVKMWVSFSKDDELAYPALYKIGLFQTPGFEPSPITPIPETLDFSLYNLVNAPWVLPSDLSGYATKAEATLSVTYSQNPQFTDWTVNYSFEVSWDNEHSIWVFESGFGDTVSGDTEEWSDPNATHLYVNYNGNSLEANRTRLDVGYVLGTQTDKPLQPMGAYAPLSSLEEVNDSLSSLNESVMNLDINKADAETVQDLADSLSAYATTDSLSAYATTASLSTTNDRLDNAIRFIGQVSQQIQYATSQTEVTQDSQHVIVVEREVKGIVIPSDLSVGTVLLDLPTNDARYVTDFIVDIDNRKQTDVTRDPDGDEASSFYWYAVDSGETLSAVMNAEAGKITRLYFTTTGITREYLSTPMPVLHVSKMALDVVGHTEVE